MFRRFRQRRALRAIERNKKLQQSEPLVDSKSLRQTDTIFRSVHSTSTFQAVPSVRTSATVSSFSGDDNEDEHRLIPPVTTADTIPSQTQSQEIDNISCTSFAKGILVDGDVDVNEKIVDEDIDTSKNDSPSEVRMDVDTVHHQSLQRIDELSVDDTNSIVSSTHHHKRNNSSCTHNAAKANLRNVLDEIQNEIYVSEQMKEELFVTQIQLAFFKESYNELERELQKKNSMMQRQELELILTRKVIKYHKEESSNTKQSFQESVMSLVEMKMAILSLQEQLNQHNDELRALKQNSLQ
jgi:hypothetical protein